MLSSIVHTSITLRVVLKVMTYEYDDVEVGSTIGFLSMKLTMIQLFNDILYFCINLFQNQIKFVPKKNNLNDFCLWDIGSQPNIKVNIMLKKTKLTLLK